MSKSKDKPPRRKVVQVFFVKNILIWNGIFFAGIFLIVTLTDYYNTDWFVNPLLGGLFGYFFYNAWKSTGRKCWGYYDGEDFK